VKKDPPLSLERKIFDFHFPAYGSLYHKKDLAGETQIPIVEDFCKSVPVMGITEGKGRKGGTYRVHGQFRFCFVCHAKTAEHHDTDRRYREKDF
jgi:hypothetical protein